SPGCQATRSYATGSRSTSSSPVMGSRSRFQRTSGRGSPAPNLRGEHPRERAQRFFFERTWTLAGTSRIHLLQYFNLGAPVNLDEDAQVQGGPREARRDRDLDDSENPLRHRGGVRDEGANQGQGDA